MIRNYFNVAVRNLVRKKAYTLINIVGLATGITFCILIYMYVQHERSFDTFHAHAEKLYRLEISGARSWKSEKTASGIFSFLSGWEDERNQLVTPLILGPELLSTFSEVEDMLRFTKGWNNIVRSGDQSFKEEHVLYADPNFFQMFSFPLSEGNPHTALSHKNSIVITQKTAQKYFGSENAMGKTLELVDKGLYTVTGIAENIPSNSSMYFDFLLPIVSVSGYEAKVEQGFNSSTVLTVLKLSEGISSTLLEKKLNQFGQIYFESYISNLQAHDHEFQASDFHLKLRAFTDGHYHTSTPWGHYTSLSNIYQLVFLTALILLIACLNYILLTLTNTAARSQEVGLRKVIGAARWQIVGQFWVETQVIVLIAVLLGWVAGTTLLPYFNTLMDSNIHLHAFRTSEIILALSITSLVVGTLAGLYPALFVSGFKPLSIIRTHRTFRLNPHLSRAMVVVQYTSCLILLIASLVIVKQLKLMNEKDLGFDEEQILVVENPDWGNAQKTSITLDNLQAYAATNPDIIEFSGTGYTFGYGYNTNLEQINGKKEGIIVLDVGYNYFDLLDLDILEGRAFSPEILTDTSLQEKRVVINQTLFRMLDEDAKIGEYNETIRRKIIGVVEDYHYNSVAMPIGPAMHQLSSQHALYFWFRLGSANLPQQIKKIKKDWSEITENQPFSYTFLDQDVAKLYASQQRWMKIINVATIFAVLVSCLGLFGLSGMNALNRVKEIGIRKVLGASVSQVLLLLNKDTFRLAFISFTIAIPIAAYFMHQWLQSFAYRIELSWQLFAVASGLGMITAILAVSYHSLKAALMNPVKSLRSE